MWLEYFRQYADKQFPIELEKHPWNYKCDLYMLGAQMLADTTGDPFWEASLLAAADSLIDKRGTVRNWRPGEHNLDKISFAKSLYILQKHAGYEYCRQAFLHAWELLQAHPRTPRGNFWHKDIYPDQVWLDGLYMAMPFYALCVAELGANPSDILTRFQEARALLWVPKKRLYIHACDESRRAQWADPTTGKSPAFWLRAEGWLLMALVDTYEILHGKCTLVDQLSRQLREAVDGLLPYTDPESRMLLQVIDRADLKGNYPETSGSAMVAYALMKGARLGMLPEEYGWTGSDMLDAICKKELKRERDGLHLYGICASAGLGPGPDHRTDRTGTPAYYLSERQIPDNLHGTAACMMAVSEQMLQKSVRERPAL